MDGYKTRVIVYNIEGVPTQEQIDSDKAEQKVKIDPAGKRLAQGYIYHGIDEKEN